MKWIWFLEHYVYGIVVGAEVGAIAGMIRGAIFLDTPINLHTVRSQQDRTIQKSLWCAAKYGFDWGLKAGFTVACPPAVFVL